MLHPLDLQRHMHAMILHFARGSSRNKGHPLPMHIHQLSLSIPCMAATAMDSNAKPASPHAHQQGGAIPGRYLMTESGVVPYRPFWLDGTALPGETQLLRSLCLVSRPSADTISRSSGLHSAPELWACPDGSSSLRGTNADATPGEPACTCDPHLACRPRKPLYPIPSIRAQ